MAKYKLTYFDFAGSRGEECRLALSVAGVDFEDHRIERSQWSAMKPTTPFGSLPFLQVAGKAPLAQSNAILSYVGRTHGLHPSDPWEAALHEAVMAAAEDLRVEVNATGSIEDPDEKRRVREQLVSGNMQTWGQRVERQITGPFVSGERMHVVDIKIYQVVRAYRQGVIDHVPGTVFASFPKLEALYTAVHAHPKIAAWRDRAS